LGELAPLTVADISTDQDTAVTFITIKEDLDEGRWLKTIGSRRAVPVHPELMRIGFMRFVDNVRQGNGNGGRLFPLLTPGPKGGFGEAWSKWFGRHIRDLGVTNRASVFHSFRHGFKDALRAASVNEDVNDALTGHIGVASVARSYGAKQMVRRFGVPVLAEAVTKVAYPGHQATRSASGLRDSVVDICDQPFVVFDYGRVHVPEMPPNSASALAFSQLGGAPWPRADSPSVCAIRRDGHPAPCGNRP
jgi:hypothetical protein